MKSMENLKDMICRELEEIADKDELSAGDLDMVYKLAVAKEKILKAETLEDELGYSSSMDGRYDMRSMRDDGMRGDSYGRHSSRGRYSRDDGYDPNRMRR